MFRMVSARMTSQSRDERAEDLGNALSDSDHSHYRQSHTRQLVHRFQCDEEHRASKLTEHNVELPRRILAVLFTSVDISSNHERPCSHSRGGERCRMNSRRSAFSAKDRTHTGTRSLKLGPCQLLQRDESGAVEERVEESRRNSCSAPPRRG